MDGLAREDVINQCRNPRHQRTSGCPKCGVVIMGTTNNKEKYVVAVDIDIGTETLTLLSVFISSMWKAKREHTPVLEAETKALEDYQDVIFHEVVRRIQKWWYVRFNLKKLRNNATKIKRSLYYLRIRKLVFMKRMVDHFASEEGKIDIEIVLNSYSEYEMEVREYVAHVMNTKLVNIHNLVKKFISNTRTAVLQRKKQMQKRLELEKKSSAYYDKYAGGGENDDDTVDEYSVTVSTKKLSKKEYRIKQKIRNHFIARLRKLEQQRFICVRPNCHMREFLTRDRYDTHMRTMHYNAEDAVKARLQEKARGKRELRQITEDIVLNRIYENHLSLTVSRPPHMEQLNLEFPLKKVPHYDYLQAPPNSNANTPRSLYKLGIKKKEIMVEGLENSSLDSSDYDVGKPPVDYQTSLSVLSHVREPDPPRGEYYASVEDTLDAMHHASIENASGYGTSASGSNDTSVPGSSSGSRRSPSTKGRKKKDPLDVVNHYKYSCPSFAQDVITIPLENAFNESVLLSDEIELHQKKKTLKQYKQAEGEILTKQVLDQLSICMPSSFRQYVALKHQEELELKIERERQEKLQLLEDGNDGYGDAPVKKTSLTSTLNSLKRKDSILPEINVYRPDNPTAKEWSAAVPIPMGAVVAPDWSGLNPIENDQSNPMPRIRYTTNCFSDQGSVTQDGEESMKEDVDAGALLAFSPIQQSGPNACETMSPMEKNKPHSTGSRYNRSGWGDVIERPVSMRSQNTNNFTPGNRTTFMQLYGKLFHLELVSFREGLKPPFKIPLNAPVLKIGTLESACGNNTITCSELRDDGSINDDVLFVRDEKNAYKRSFPLISRTHCVISVPMCSGMDYADSMTNSLIAVSESRTMKGPGDIGMQPFNDVHSKSVDSMYSVSTDNDHLDSDSTVTEHPITSSVSGKRPHMHELCTVVDNHTFGGTYIVSIDGVKKVPKKTSKGLPLHSGDLLCIGIGRVDQNHISPTEASKACVVYKIRCVDMES